MAAPRRAGGRPCHGPGYGPLGGISGCWGPPGAETHPPACTHPRASLSCWGERGSTGCCDPQEQEKGGPSYGGGTAGPRAWQGAGGGGAGDQARGCGSRRGGIPAGQPLARGRGGGWRRGGWGEREECPSCSPSWRNPVSMATRREQEGHCLEEGAGPRGPRAVPPPGGAGTRGRCPGPGSGVGAGGPRCCRAPAGGSGRGGTDGRTDTRSAAPACNGPPRPLPGAGGG